MTNIGIAYRLAEINLEYRNTPDGCYNNLAPCLMQELFKQLISDGMPYRAAIKTVYGFYPY